MKSYVRNTINLSCAKILLTSVINVLKAFALIVSSIWILHAFLLSEMAPTYFTSFKKELFLPFM